MYKCVLSYNYSLNSKYNVLSFFYILDSYFKMKILTDVLSFQLSCIHQRLLLYRTFIFIHKSNTDTCLHSITRHVTILTDIAISQHFRKNDKHFATKTYY